jgi:hypothetical protein
MLQSWHRSLPLEPTPTLFHSWGVAGTQTSEQLQPALSYSRALAVPFDFRSPSRKRSWIPVSQISASADRLLVCQISASVRRFALQQALSYSRALAVPFDFHSSSRKGSLIPVSQISASVGHNALHSALS